MSDAFHDNNGTPTLLAVETDGATLTVIECDPSSHRLSTSDGTTGSDNGPTVSLHDDSHVHIIMATSSSDGKTPIPIYADGNNNLLIDSV